MVAAPADKSNTEVAAVKEVSKVQPSAEDLKKTVADSKPSDEAKPMESEASNSKDMNSEAISSKLATAAEKLSAGKKSLLQNQPQPAVDHLAEACALQSSVKGDMCYSMCEYYFYYGRALLDLARIEGDVLGNALSGVPDGDDLENSQVENPEKMTEEEKETVAQQVDDALEENYKKVEGIKDGEGKEGAAEAMEEGESKEEESKADKDADKAEDKSEKADKAEDKSEKADKVEAKSEKADKVEAKSEKADKVEAKSEKADKVEDKSEKADKVEDKSEKADKVVDEKDSDSKDSKKEEKMDEAEAKAEESKKDEKSEASAVNGSSKEAEKEGEEAVEGDEEDAEEDGDEEEGEEVVEDEAAAEGEEVSQESSQEDEEDVSSLQLAWEVLELAKTIYQKREEKTDDDVLKLSQVFLKLGEVCLENENYPESINMYTECLKLQESVLPADDRWLAETHYQLGLAHSLADNFDEAVQQLEAAIAVIEARVKSVQGKLKEEKIELADDMDLAALSQDQKSWVADVRELEKLLPELQDKVTDIKDTKVSFTEKLKAMKAHFSGQLSGGSSGKSAFEDSASTSSASAFEQPEGTEASKEVKTISTSLIRKKRKPDEQVQSTEGAKKPRIEEPAAEKASEEKPKSEKSADKKDESSEKSDDKKKADSPAKKSEEAKKEDSEEKMDVQESEDKKSES